MSPRPVFASVQEYLASLEPPQRKALKQVLAQVRKAVPGTTAVISYGIPAFRRQGRVFIYCAAFRHHIGIYPPVRGNAPLQKALKGHANARGNLAFPLDEALSPALIIRIAKALAVQQDSAAA